MADFRKWFLAFAVVTLLSGLAVTASAQTVTCNATAGQQPIIRSEGVAEQVGDVVLTCPALAAGTQVNIAVFLNAFVTSRITTGTTSDALLLINEPAAGTASLTGTTPNVIQGQLQNLQAGANGTSGYTSVVWTGITVPASPTIRITNIRVDALSAPASGGQFIPATIQEFVSITGFTTGTGVINIPNPQLTVAYVQPGLGPSRTIGTGTFTQCAGQNEALVGGGASASTAADVAQYGIMLTEGFPYAFKTSGNASGTPGTPQNVPGKNYFTESSFWDPALGTDIGQATSATRFFINLTGVASGMTVYLPITVPLYNAAAPAGTAPTGSAQLATCNASGTSCSLVTTSDAAGTLSGANAAAAFPKLTTAFGTGNYALAAVDTTGNIYYEVTASNPFSLETAAIPVVVAFATGQPVTAAGNPAPSLSVGFAPQNTDTLTLTTDPIPRFGPSSTAPNPGTLPFAVNPCQCNLLFPYVTSVANFDTGLAISNTSMDPWGTLNQHGTVKFYFYGNTYDQSGTATPLTTAQQTGVSPDVPAGSTYAFSVYSGDQANGATLGALPNFSGYVIATAGFQYCHGLAFLSGFGRGAQDQGASEAYLGLVLDPSTLSRSTGAQGEVLGN